MSKCVADADKRLVCCHIFMQVTVLYTLGLKLFQSIIYIGYKLTITGHSLGAGTAELVSMQLLSSPKILPFNTQVCYKETFKGDKKNENESKD